MTTISNNRRKKVAPGIVLFFIVAFLLLLGAYFLRAPLSNLLWQVGNPLLEAKNKNGAAAADFFTQFSSNTALVAENASLKAQLASTSILLMDRDLLVQENAELKVRLGRDGEPLPTLAAVLLVPPAT